MTTGRPARPILLSLVAALAWSTALSAHAATGGAETPEALMARLKESGETRDVSVVVDCVVPEERGLLAFLIGMIPIEMLGSMAAMSAQQSGDPEIQQQVARIHTGYQELLAKYGIQSIDPKNDLDMNDPAAAAKVLDGKLGKIDHTAFIKDSMALVESVHPAAGPLNPAAQFSDEVKTIDVDGETAMVSFQEAPQQVQLVKRSGRWYLRLVPPGY